MGEIASAPRPMEEIKEQLGENLAFVAGSQPMRKVRAQVQLLAKVNVPILLVGESGSGKEVVAKLIHRLSNRSEGKFLKMSCAALDPDSLERQLFGKEGAKTSDEAAREISPFAICENGTLLLEDIDEMPLRTQAKLACLLQDKQFSSDGENPVDLDVRVLAATKVNVGGLLEQKLRKELYYCLSAFTIFVPPLRQRVEEIPLLLQHFMNRIATEYRLPVRYFSPEILAACRSYSWPGNLRELETFVKRYLVSGDGETLWSREEIEDPQNAWTRPTETGIEPFDLGTEMSASKSLLHAVREEAERNAITTALEQTGWNRSAAARLLKVSYRTLLYKIQQYEMSPQKG
jgi:two-component system, NtrC family, response regulator AtoC